MKQPTNLFRVVSKNTGTINLQNMDMIAITKELMIISASVFAAQETNVHWNEDTLYHLQAQCRKAAPQTQIATSTSAEDASEWHKPGGTITMALNNWTNRVIKKGSDSTLGRWSFIELVGKHDKRLIVVSAYRVCNQQFDAASQMVTAQQIRLLQAQGVATPKPRKIFLDDIIKQIQIWRRENKEIIICMDANDPVDDPKADISRLFMETDLIDLHHHHYPGTTKPATQQRGSRAIDLIIGSPCVAAAMVHAWICPFGEPAMIKGDHRLLGIDFDPEVLFGNAIAPPITMVRRGVHSRHEQKVTTFCDQVVKKCNKAHLAERILVLQKLPTLAPHHLEELEKIDEQLTKILTQMDKQCTPPNPDPWSPELDQAYLRHRLWTTALSAHKNQRNMSDAIKAIWARLHPSPEDEDEQHRSISANLRHAQKQLRRAKREAERLRKQHLETLINEAKVANRRKKSKILEHLIRAEQNRTCYQLFRQNTKPKLAGGLAYIMTMDSNTGEKTTILDRDEMDTALLNYSRTHFAKAQGTPFTVEPLQHLLQYDGLTSFGARVLKGQAYIEDLPLDEPTKALLTHLQSKHPDTDSRHPLVYEELQEGIKKWPERTTTSPSGRHLGIYKSLQWHVLRKDDKEKTQPTNPPVLINQGRDVLYLIFDIMLLALQHTYTLNRWKTVWTMFIEKDLGNPDLNRLHCIMIFEADWQLLLKWHSAKGFLPKSEAQHTLTSVQGGGRKGSSAIDQATQQVVEQELLHLNQKPALDLFLDLRHCFDYMVEACHNMACRRHGAAEDYLRLHAQTHRLMRYYVRHKYGVSSDYNTYEDHPWHGAGQGAADAALRYIVLSDSLIDAYHARFQPWTMHDPTLTITMLKSIKAFIDDVAMSAGGPVTSFPDLIHRAQTQLQWWTSLVRSSGGELNPAKCCCAIYHWTPDKNGILKPSTPAPETTIILSDPQTLTQPIPILDMQEGTRYLGIYVTRSGATKPMEDHVWQIAVTYTRAFQRTHMSRHEATVLYRSCFLPALTYSFPATWMPLQFLDRIHKLSTSTILNKMGFHSRLPRELVFAPREVGGVGLCNLVYEQGTQQLLMLLRHLRARNTLGTAIEGLIQMYQLWAGICNHILSDTQPCPWIPDHWLSHLRKTMHLYNIRISYNSWTYPPL